MSADGSIGERFKIMQELLGSRRLDHTVNQKSYHQEENDKNKSFDKSHRDVLQTKRIAIYYIYSAKICNTN